MTHQLLALTMSAPLLFIVWFSYTVVKEYSKEVVKYQEHMKHIEKEK